MLVTSTVEVNDCKVRTGDTTVTKLRYSRDIFVIYRPYTFLVAFCTIELVINNSTPSLMYLRTFVDACPGSTYCWY
ncbi:hypothetical protein PHLGIDRAFT_486390 [Phlebiopsis gigantea 11061_1 CR5-6]|uniref:Uncharacterized protein n=1 Tax=Phlebiopsis gigantea (strain 11061_1 CR5-6) TaxID=745531 RepID=A0A0C3S5N9_PHLG1|nr:hypothetical protein PHLGIDRAFT_486390 [Phlebiopsis gigantea 11061_1 CR5-6]